MNCGTWNNNPAYNDFAADNWENMQDFVNNCIGIITSTTTSAGKPMTARCFNDAICYNNDSSHCGSVSKNVEILYWGSGWSGFSPANTSVLQKMITQIC